MKGKLLKKLAAIMTLAMMMTCIMAPTFSYGAEAVNVEVSVQKGDTFYMAHKQLKVASDLAETYGYEDKVTGGKVSALDVLVAAHIEKYGTDKDTINNKLKMSNGNPNLIMGDAAKSGFAGFTINEDYPMDENKLGYNLNGAPVNSGDRLDFFWYEDDFWGDYVSVFTDENGEKIFNKEIKVGEEAKISLKGFMYMMGYDQPGYSPINSAGIYLLDNNGKISKPLKNGDAAVVTDENGMATVSFDTAGTYYLTALDDSGDFGFKIVMPWLAITVTEDEPVPTEPETPSDTTDPAMPSDTTDPAITDNEKVPDGNQGNTTNNDVEKASTSNGEVKTEDSFNMALFVGIMALAAAGAVGTVAIRRKSTEK